MADGPADIAANDDVVVVAGGEHIAVLDADDGQQRWTASVVDAGQEPRLRPSRGGPGGRRRATPSCSCRHAGELTGRRSTRPGECGFSRLRRAGYRSRIGWAPWSSGGRLRLTIVPCTRSRFRRRRHRPTSRLVAWVRGRLAPTGEDLEERAGWRVKTRWILGAWAVLSAFSALGTALTPALLAFPMLLVAFTPAAAVPDPGRDRGQPGALLRRRRPPDARRRPDPHRPRPPLRRALRARPGAAHHAPPRAGRGGVAPDEQGARRRRGLQAADLAGAHR